MGATVAHGRELYKKREILEDGSAFVEIVPLGGDYDFPSYSSVEALVSYASSKGVDASLWPIYYDVPPSDVDVQEIYQRCESLRLAISSLTDEVIRGNPWLPHVADWLKSGEGFYIGE